MVMAELPPELEEKRRRVQEVLRRSGATVPGKGVDYGELVERARYIATIALDLQYGALRRDNKVISDAVRQLVVAVRALEEAGLPVPGA